jgi:hypothetical protein
MKVAVIGSRDFDDYAYLSAVLDCTRNLPGIDLISSGGARGADRLAEKYGKQHDIPTKIFPAEWDKYGKSAGYRRNIDIVSEAEMVIAFWDGQSKGTKNSIDLAKKQGKLVSVYTFGKFLDQKMEKYMAT